MQRRTGFRSLPAWAVLAALVAFTGMLVVSHPAQTVARQSSGSVKSAMLHQAPRAALVLSQPMVQARRAAARSRAFAPGHIVVKFARQMRVREMRDLASEAGATRVVRPRYADYHYVEIPQGQDPVEAARALAAQPGVVYAEPDPIVHPLFKPNDPYYKLQWNLPAIGMEAAWDINRGGASKVTVAVIDTGVCYLNQGAFAQADDLAGTRFAAGYDFIWNDDTPVDTDGHGTHVTGTIAQTTNNNLGAAGIAFNVTIMPVKVLASDYDARHNAPNESTMSILAQGIRFAVDHGAKVLNLSLGSDEPSSPVESAIRYAVAQGAFVAVAAGNGGEEGNPAEWPAAYANSIDGVMAVAGVDFNLARAPYSTSHDYVEIAAPGGNVDADLNKDGYGDGILQETLDPDFVEHDIFNRFQFIFFQGTSMATAHVSAVAALLYGQGITSPAAIEAIIKATASKKPSGGHNNDIGYGVIDPRTALRGFGLAK